MLPQWASPTWDGGSVASPGLVRGRLVDEVFAHVATAPFTAVPAEASGTFNPLRGVLCILRSLYLCAIGPRSVCFLAADTRRASNCSPKPLYSWIRAAARRRDHGTLPAYGTVALGGDPFQGSSWGRSRRRTATRSTAHSICWNYHDSRSRPLWGKWVGPCGAHATSAWRQRGLHCVPSHRVCRAGKR